MSAAPAPIPDADLDDVLLAVQTAAQGLLDDLGELPDDVAQFVENVAEFPQSLPLEIVKLVNKNRRHPGSGKKVGLTVFGTLPEDLRAPAAALPLAIDGATDDVQVASRTLSRRGRSRCSPPKPAAGRSCNA